jgi:hypothetical protein
MITATHTPAHVAGLGDDAGAPIDFGSLLRWLAIGVGVALIVPALWRAFK